MGTALPPSIRTASLALTYSQEALVAEIGDGMYHL